MTSRTIARFAVAICLVGMSGSAALAGPGNPICVPVMSFDADGEGWYLVNGDGTAGADPWRSGIGVNTSAGLLLPAGVSTIQRDGVLPLDFSGGQGQVCFLGKELVPEDADAQAAMFWMDYATEAGCLGDCVSTRFPPRPPCKMADGGFRLYVFTTPMHDGPDCDLEEFASITIAHDGAFIVDSIGYVSGGVFVCDGQCDEDGECDDADSCTADLCLGGQCDNRFVAGCCHDTADCFDGLVCTSETCAAGSCDYTLIPGCCDADSDCEDGDGCTINRCDGESYTCAVPTPKACGDRDRCTTDACVEGMCVHDQILDCCVAHGDCDDRNPCTIDRCEGDACSHSPAPTGLPCDYVDACSLGDVCNAFGECVPQSTLTCDDGDVCNGVEACYAGGCAAGTPLDCGDGVDCTLDSCELGEGCLHAPDHAACDDGVACTVDHCDPLTGCRSVPSSASCDDGVACTRDLCDAALGCIYQPLSAACDDGVSCTIDICDPLRGCVTSPVDGACDDGNPCTTDDCAADGCDHADNGNCASQCGDGVCTRTEETCVTCPGDCGVCPSGDCCARRTRAGCSERPVAACVCSADSYCCVTDQRRRDAGDMGMWLGEPGPLRRGGSA